MHPFICAFQLGNWLDNECPRHCWALMAWKLALILTWEIENTRTTSVSCLWPSRSPGNPSPLNQLVSKSAFPKLNPSSLMRQIWYSLSISNKLKLRWWKNSKYLGSLINGNESSSKEVHTQMASAAKVFAELNSCRWRKRLIPLHTGVHIYEALVISVLLYVCKSWVLKASEVHDLKVFDHSCLRLILGVRLADRMSNADPRRSCSQHLDIGSVIKKHRLRWYWHIQRRPPEALT